MKPTRPTSSSHRILIAGAGIGGLVTALSLLHRGIDCDVYEQAPELREVGAGLWISANGARVLFDLGLKDELERAAIAASERAIRLWNSGEKWPLYEAGASAASHKPYVLLRAHLLRMLQDAVQRLKPGAIHLNARCAGFTEADGKVTLKLEDGSEAVGTALIGADGIHSRIREQAFGQVESRYTNALAWRGLVPVDRLAPHQARHAVYTWVGPSAHVTVYPVRWQDTALLTFSAQVEHSEWQLESWSVKGDPADCLRDFAGWHPDIIEMITHVDTLHKWGIFVREPLPRWSKGRVTLLGDACHSMVPYLGQGVNMAIEDACVLSRYLEANADPVRAFELYQNERKERAETTARRAADMQGIFHNAALASRETAGDYILSQWGPAQNAARYNWIYDYDATSVKLRSGGGLVGAEA
ncbi:FAD-dependent monooxygenase [Bradyrhizobium sp. NP1]|uniref:FAD-dependent monooxygenase n=1 Tax=Bradyrhizobium sp. NP1 TaxID=3049772 RepID=UPI0025A4FECD|nr:FAD-dependent monooxygenase [Bradyrhizobium sp. NP1]WJR79898.1 FAD-dependent monooxygenase [Bradyrhizobium sp. NP1]